jgi:hypothetical protein
MDKVTTIDSRLTTNTASCLNIESNSAGILLKAGKYQCQSLEVELNELRIK